MQTPSRHNRVRRALVVLFAFVALNAFAGGVYGMSGAEGVPTDLLRGSPFDDYFLPSVILFVAVGGSCLVAAAAALRRHRAMRPVALGAAAVLLVWIVTQLLIIGYVSWMQPVFRRGSTTSPPTTRRARRTTDTCVVSRGWGFPICWVDMAPISTFPRIRFGSSERGVACASRSYSETTLPARC